MALFADEAFFAGDKQHDGVLKGLITEPTLPIEGKFQNVVEVLNVLHVMIASNSDWIVPASQDERRYCVLDVFAQPRLPMVKRVPIVAKGQFLAPPARLG